MSASSSSLNALISPSSSSVVPATSASVGKVLFLSDYYLHQFLLFRFKVDRAKTSNIDFFNPLSFCEVLPLIEMSNK